MWRPLEERCVGGRAGGALMARRMRSTAPALRLMPLCSQTPMALQDVAESSRHQIFGRSMPLLRQTSQPASESEGSPLACDASDYQWDTISPPTRGFGFDDSPRLPMSPTSLASSRHPSSSRLQRSMSVPLSPMQTTIHRPWRKPKAEVEAERAEAEIILGIDRDTPGGSGVDDRALLFCLVAQETLNEMMAEAACPNSSKREEESAAMQAAQAAVDALRQVATNAASAEEVERRRNVTTATLDALGLSDVLKARVKRPIVTKYDACHRLLHGFWLGSWVALNNDCEELRRRKVTHVVSIVSTEQRTLPDFIRGHLHICADDREEAAVELSSHFPEICRFVDIARSEPRGSVYIHCGAGISRAPTAAASYIMWKLGVSAAVALQLIKKARSNIRPNLGFIKQLRRWEVDMKSLPGGGNEFSAGRGCLTYERPKEHLPLSPKFSRSSSEKSVASKSRSRKSSTGANQRKSL